MEDRRADPEALAKIAETQRGLFTRRQARDCGYSAYQVRRRRESDEWITVLHDVLAMRGAVVTPRIRDVAAHLAMPGAVLAGPSAARWLGIEAPDARTFVQVGSVRHPTLATVVFLRDPLPAEDIWLIDEYYMTSRERTVFDCLKVLPDQAATTLLDRALQRGWTSLDDLTERTRISAGRWGTPRLARLVGAAASGARSASERLVVTLLRRAGLWGWLANEPIQDRWGVIGIGDIVFPRAHLVIELDGRAYHIDPDRFQRDRERQNRLVAAGWTVLRFTWYDLSKRPDHVTQTISAMLDRLGVRG